MARPISSPSRSMRSNFTMPVGGGISAGENARLAVRTSAPSASKLVQDPAQFGPRVQPQHQGRARYRALRRGADFAQKSREPSHGWAAPQSRERAGVGGRLMPSLPVAFLAGLDFAAAFLAGAFFVVVDFRFSSGFSGSRFPSCFLGGCRFGRGLLRGLPALRFGGRCGGCAGVDELDRLVQA